MSLYRVKNWRKFQHYKDRNPPWIKLHWELLSSMDWVTLNDASRVLAVACMLVASRNDGEIRGDETGLKYLQRVAHLNSKPDLKPLISCGLLESASTMLATCLQDARPETYKDSTQIPTEEEGQARKRASPLPEDWTPSQNLRAWAKQQGFGSIDQHADYFRDYCKANRKLYVDHGAAFRNCIKADWGGIRKANGSGNGQHSPIPAAHSTTTTERVLAEAIQAKAAASPMPDSIRAILPRRPADEGEECSTGNVG